MPTVKEMTWDDYDKHSTRVRSEIAKALRARGHKVSDDLQRVDGIFFYPRFSWYGRMRDFGSRRPSTESGDPIVQLTMDEIRTRTKKDGTFDVGAVVQAIERSLEHKKADKEKADILEKQAAQTKAALIEMGLEERTTDWLSTFAAGGAKLQVNDDGSVSATIEVPFGDSARLKELVDFCAGAATS